MLLEVNHKTQTSPEPLVNNAILASLQEQAVAEFALKIPDFIKSEQSAMHNNTNGFDVQITSKLIVIHPDKLVEALNRTSLDEHARLRLMVDICRS